MPPKIFDNYEDALAYLEKLYNQTMVGNPKQANLYNLAIMKLKGWIARGKIGSCPIDLLQFGMVVIQPEEIFYSYKGVRKHLGELYTQANVGNPTQASEYKRDARLIKDWEDNGKQGSCPVNLLTYGIEVRDPPESGTPAPPTDIPVPAPRTDTRVPATSVVKDLYLQGDKLRRAKDYTGAADCYRKVLELDPVNAHALAALVDSLNLQGDKLRKDGAFTGAVECYREALVLDPRNTHAPDGLVDCELATTIVDLKKLKSELKEMVDFERLERGIKAARDREDQDELSADMQELLQSAKQRLEEKKRSDGKITTLMHLASLVERKKAVDNLIELIQTQPSFFDSETNVWIKTADALRKANEGYEQESGAAYQRLSEGCESEKLTTPRLAAEKILQNLQQPFFPQHRHKLDLLLRECQDNDEKKSRAYAIENEAKRLGESDPVGALRLWYEARDLWPHDLKLDAKVVDAFKRAESSCVLQIDKLLRDARNGERSADDRDKDLDRAKKIIRDWPTDPRPSQSGEVPADFKSRLEKVEVIRKEISQQRKLYKDFKDFEVLIRGLINRGEFTKASDKMRECENIFGALDEFRQLDRLVAGDLSLQEQIEHYEGIVNRDPEIVVAWAEKCLPTAGGLAAKVQDLLARARLIVAANQVKQQMEQYDFERADKAIGALRHTLVNARLVTLFDDLLGDDIKRIERAKKQPGMKRLYDKAEKLVGQAGEDYQGLLESMRLFQHVGGQDAGLPAITPGFAESVWQLSAFMKADGTRVRLRAKLLDLFETAYLDGRVTLSGAIEWDFVFECADVLLENKLFDDASKRVMVRAVLVACAHQECKNLDAAGLEGETAVWESLIVKWPGKDVRAWLEEAKERGENIRGAADAAKASKNPLEALEILAKALQAKDSSKLRTQRDQIFQENERELLTKIRKCGAHSSDSVIGLALLAVDEMRGLERSAETPRETWKSEGEYQRLKDLLAKHNYAGRLADLTQIFVRLSAVDGLPNSDGTPQTRRDWSKWIASGNWGEHDAVVNYAMTVAFEQLAVVVELVRNVSAHKLARQQIYLLITELRNGFSTEDFESVFSVLSKLDGFRNNVPGATVLSVMDPQISAFTYEGFNTVRVAANRFIDELMVWKGWYAECESLHAAAVTEHQQAAAGPGPGNTLTRTAQRQIWTDVKKACEVPSHLRKDPPVAGYPVAKESELRKVGTLATAGNLLLQKCDGRRSDAEQKVAACNMEIEAFGGFPTVAAFTQAANALRINPDSTNLRTLLDNAALIGSVEPGEGNRLIHYRNVFNSLQARTFWMRWRDRLGA